jgi:hypothetical protein
MHFSNSAVDAVSECCQLLVWQIQTYKDVVKHHRFVPAFFIDNNQKAPLCHTMIRKIPPNQEKTNAYHKLQLEPSVS